MLLTWEEALAQERAQGKAEGLLKAEAEGMTRGFLKAIVLVAERLHGSVPAAFVEALGKIDDPSRLRELLDQALTVSSLEELDLEWSPRA